jgi:hypothetical protein
VDTATKRVAGVNDVGGNTGENEKMTTEGNLKRAQTVWDKAFKPPKHGKTDHAEARRLAERGWGKHECRADWESDVCRYHGPFTLPTNKESL